MDKLRLLHSDPRLFFFNDTATPEIYTLSLHDALPIFAPRRASSSLVRGMMKESPRRSPLVGEDRKSTRLNSSHVKISYAVFCLKKKNETPAVYRGVRACRTWRHWGMRLCSRASYRVVH